MADFETCGLGCWGTNSQIAHAVSTSPLGPFVKKDVVAPPFRHTPTLNKVPGGPYVIVSIGNGTCATPGGGSAACCPKTFPSCNLPPAAAVAGLESEFVPDAAGPMLGDPGAAGIITMLYSDSMNGPWKQRAGVVLEPSAANAWDSFVTNPSLYFFPNGSAIMVYRGGPCMPKKSDPHPKTDRPCDGHHVAIATAPSWKGPFTRVDTPGVDGPYAWPNQTEDPGIFRDARGNFHIIGHSLKNSFPGGHSFSRDGLSWTFAGSAYGFDVAFTDGSKSRYGRRERPQVLVVDGEPTVLYNGVEGPESWGNSSHTLAQRIATKADVERMKQEEREDGGRVTF